MVAPDTPPLVAKSITLPDSGTLISVRGTAKSDVGAAGGGVPHPGAKTTANSHAG
jgi:hypothetical protein